MHGEGVRMDSGEEEGRGVGEGGDDLELGLKREVMVALRAVLLELLHHVRLTRLRGGVPASVRPGPLSSGAPPSPP